eukprot:65219-Pelagomonas_calceolata.AAC.1
MGGGESGLLGQMQLIVAMLHGIFTLRRELKEPVTYCPTQHSTSRTLLVPKNKTHAGIIGNKGADACECTAALTDTMDIEFPGAMDPVHDLYLLSLKSGHGRNGGPHCSNSLPHQPDRQA